MAKALYEEQAVANIAAAIREKNKSEETYTVAEMAEAIKSLTIREKLKQSNQSDVVITGITCISNATTDVVIII